MTSEARQALYGLCSDSGSPLFGKVLPGLLVVHGTHARLSNIDSSGKFISDESFRRLGALLAVCCLAGERPETLLRRLYAI